MTQHILTSAAQLLHAMSGEDRGRPKADRFFDSIYAIGKGEVPVEAEELRTFLQKTSADLTGASTALHAYLFETEDMLSEEFYGDEWRKVCRRRSAIEFFRTLYRDVIDMEWHLFMDCENLDDMLKQKGEHEGGLPPDQIPANIPASHWWWRI